MKVVHVVARAVIVSRDWSLQRLRQLDKLLPFMYFVQQGTIKLSKDV
jgi:hypothetical protein